MTEVVDIVFQEKGAQKVSRSINGVSNSSARAGSTVDFLKKGLISLGAAISVREIIRLADSFSLTRSRIALVTDSVRELTQVQRELFNISQQTRSSMDSTAELYSRIARNADDLGLSQSELLGVTKAVNQAIQISGVSAQSANAAIVQLGQGLASGALRGDELRSVLEQVPRLAQAIAEGMGVTVGKLRELGAEGAITADTVIHAIRSQAPELAKEFEKVPITVGAALVHLRNSAQRFVGNANDATGATNALAGAIMNFSEFVSSDKTFDELSSVFQMWKFSIIDISDELPSITTELNGIQHAGGEVVGFLKDAFVNLPINVSTAVKIATIEITSFIVMLNTKMALLSLSAEKNVKGSFLDMTGAIKISLIDVGATISEIAAKTLKFGNTAQRAVANILGDDDAVDSLNKANNLIDERISLVKENRDIAISAIEEERIERDKSYAERKVAYKEQLAIQKTVADESIDNILNERKALMNKFEQEKANLAELRELKNKDRISVDTGEGVSALKTESGQSSEDKKAEKKLEQQRRYNEMRLLLLEESALSEIEFENIEFDRKMSFLANFNESEVKLIKDKQTLIEKLEVQHKARLGNINAQAALQRQKFDEMNATQKLAFTVSTIKQITASSAQENKKAFRLHKAAAITEGIINGIRGVMYALGSYPPPLNFVMAGLVGAAAAINVNKIKSQQFGGGGGGASLSSSGGGGGGGASSSSLDIPQPIQQTQGATEQSGVGSVQIIINGAITEDMVNDVVIPIIQDATNNRNVVLFEPGSRQDTEIREAS